MTKEIALTHLESKEIPVELIGQILDLIPQLLEMISRKTLRKQVELHGQLLTLLSARVMQLEQK